MSSSPLLPPLLHFARRGGSFVVNTALNAIPVIGDAVSPNSVGGIRYIDDGNGNPIAVIAEDSITGSITLADGRILGAGVEKISI